MMDIKQWTHRTQQVNCGKRRPTLRGMEAMAGRKLCWPGTRDGEGGGTEAWVPLPGSSADATLVLLSRGSSSRIRSDRRDKRCAPHQAFSCRSS